MSIRQDDDGCEVGWPERARILGRRVRTAFRVRYAETDQMGVAYYANYLVWFEVMRGDFMRAIGLPYTELEARGWNLPIAEASVRYHLPARYDDVIEVEARLTRVRSRVITFTYRVERGDQCLAVGSTTHVPVDGDGRPRAFAPDNLALLARFLDTEPAV